MKYCCKFYFLDWHYFSNSWFWPACLKRFQHVCVICQAAIVLPLFSPPGTKALSVVRPSSLTFHIFEPLNGICRNLTGSNCNIIERGHQSECRWVWVYWCFTSHATIFQSYMWCHRCAGGLKKNLYLRSGSQHHRQFVGFFNVPVLHRHGTTLFIRWFRHTAPFSRLLRHAGDTEDVFQTLTPGVLRGPSVDMIKPQWRSQT